jgi:hypothetical protein
MKALVDAPFNVTEELDKYPKILDYSSDHGVVSCVAFEKHDGTNLAFKWRSFGGFFEVPSFRSGRTIMEELDTFGDATNVFDASVRERADEVMRPFFGSEARERDPLLRVASRTRRLRGWAATASASAPQGDRRLQGPGLASQGEGRRVIPETRKGPCVGCGFTTPLKCGGCDKHLCLQATCESKHIKLSERCRVALRSPT